MMIPNDVSSRFNTVAGRKEIVRRYADSKGMFCGINENGETVYLSVSDRGLVLKTEQENGWIRVNFYDSDGNATGESFDGKWRKNDG